MNVNDIYQNDKGSLRAQTGAAYGVTYPAALPGLSTHSPLDGNPADFTAWPIKIWASDNDNIAADTAVCQAWAASVNALGGSVEVESIGAIGHNTATTPIDDVIAFFVRHLS